MLARVERKLSGEPFVVIGVHSPKFPNERDGAMVREAVRRFAITHPVVVDSGHRIWQEYGVRAWPTLVVIDPRGYVVGAGSGEPDEEPVEEIALQILEACRADGIPLATEPLPLHPEPHPVGSYAYPGKVTGGTGRLFVADTGHHQIVEVGIEGGGVTAERRRFGIGEPGLAGGAPGTASFHHPNGLALAGDVLWVADTGNHALRRIDLLTGETTLVAGNGRKGAGLPAGTDLPPREVALRSPWDLAWDAARGVLYVAMAGTHQLFVLDPARDVLRVLAGTGRERCDDGPARDAAFAQPSGLALSGDRLYVADSEVSSIRELDLATMHVRTIAGSGDLFGFGDRDGSGGDALFQHPIGVATHGPRLLVADSFNHKVREVVPATGRVTTLFGGSGPDGGRRLFEPEGIHAADGTVWIADTNHHRLAAFPLS
ncbi:MAG: alkyl hydroperoxide reductase [Acidobacteriota bacterium]